MTEFGNTILILVSTFVSSGADYFINLNLIHEILLFWRLVRRPDTFGLARVKSGKITHFSDVPNFLGERRISNLKSSAETCGLYKICKNQPKIPVLTFISDVQGKTVHKGGRAKGGQGGPHKRPDR